MDANWVAEQLGRGLGIFLAPVIYWHASGKKIGKVVGARGFFNMSAGAWGLCTYWIWPVTVVAYLIKQRDLLEQASTAPRESPGRPIKVALFALPAVFFVLGILMALR